uniref:Uncharacterized protein n=1 Tax=Panagrolaimus davidi TaxID=227884 RepID=A0A914PJG3_9BILA
MGAEEFWSQFIENNVSQFAAVERSSYRTSPSISSSALSARQPQTYRTFSPPPPPMPRSYSSRFRRRNNNAKVVKESFDEKQPPTKPSPLMRSLSVASSLVRSFKSAF